MATADDEAAGYDEEFDFAFDGGDPALDDLSALVNQLIGIFATTFSTIPGVRQVFRVTTTPPSHGDEH